MRMTENPEIGVFVRTSNASGFFVQPDRGGGAVVSVPLSHARNHVISARPKVIISYTVYFENQFLREQA